MFAAPVCAKLIDYKTNYASLELPSLLLREGGLEEYEIKALDNIMTLVHVVFLLWLLAGVDANVITKTDFVTHFLSFLK